MADKTIPYVKDQKSYLYSRHYYNNLRLQLIKRAHGNVVGNIILLN